MTPSAPPVPPQKKRRLPMVQPADEGTLDEPSRSRWQWVGFGALAAFTAWIPLAGLAAALASRLAARAQAGELDPGHIAVLILAFYVAALVLGAVAGGFLVGRWGPGGGAGVRVRDEALSGLTAAVAALVVSVLSFGFVPGELLVPALAVPGAALGGRLGLRRRRRAPPRAT